MKTELHRDRTHVQSINCSHSITIIFKGKPLILVKGTKGYYKHFDRIQRVRVFLLVGFPIFALEGV